jgi:hypothetical protein
MVVKFSDTTNHSENEKKKMKKRIKKKIKIRDKDTGDRRVLNVSFHDFTPPPPPNILCVIELRGKRGRGTWLRWGSGEERSVQGFGGEN